MTIYDISEKAGVSIATVSRVLNGSRNVSDKTRERVLAVMEHYGYTPNAFARGLGLNTMKTMGIMCADSSDPYLAKAVYHIEQKLRSSGYDSLLCCTGYEPASKAASMNLLLTKKVDGVILAGSNFVHENQAENKYIAEAAARIPVMLLNADLEIPNVYSVLSDDFASMYEATREMLCSGIKDILFFYNTGSYSGKRKMAGYLAAVEKDENCRAMTWLYQGSNEDVPAMVKDLKKLRRKGTVFHGVMAADDVLAAAAVKYAREMNYRIPEDFSVVGYNNSTLTVCCEPELTSIDNKLEILCQHLVTTLLGVLEGREMPPKTVFSGELIRRGTTRQPPYTPPHHEAEKSGAPNCYD